MQKRKRKKTAGKREWRKLADWAGGYMYVLTRGAEEWPFEYGDYLCIDGTGILLWKGRNGLKV